MSLLTWVGVPGDSAAWAALGFAVEDSAVRIGQVTCAVGAGPGWGFDALHADAAALQVRTDVRAAPNADAHQPNGVAAVDHVVYTTPELDPAVANLTAVLGDPPRRRMRPRGPTGPEMAFFRVGAAFIEVVAGPGEPRLIGIALRAPDLDVTVAAVRAAGGPIGDPKPAVQGGRIATVWHGHLNWGLAIVEPPPK